MIDNLVPVLACVFAGFVIGVVVTHAGMRRIMMNFIAGNAAREAARIRELLDQLNLTDAQLTELELWMEREMTKLNERNKR